MKTLVVIYIMLFAVSSYAYGEEIQFNTSADLKSWCKNESAEYFLAKDKTPFNWSASEWNEGNIINVKGSWKVGVVEFVVKCRVRKGLQEKQAVISIAEKRKAVKESFDSSYAGDELQLNSSADLRLWCKNKSEKYFLAKDKAPYNWASSWRNEGNIINIKGSWKVNSMEYMVKCRVRKGLKEKYAVISIEEK